MESLKLSFESIMPIFILMAIGYLLRCVNFADKKIFDTVNKMVFKVFLPVLLFYNIYKTESAEVFNPKLIAFSIVGVLSVFAVGYFIVLKITPDNSKRGVILQSFFRSNFAILGVPLADYICAGRASGLASLMVAIVVPMFNVLAVVCLERFRDGRVKPLKLLKGIVTNPLIIGCAVGVVFFLLKIRLPSVIEKSVKDIAGVATPLALVVLGASFTFSSIKGYVREILIIVLSRLVIVPLIMMSIAVAFGFSGEALVCLLVIFASPVAVSSFAMAQQMGGDEKLASQAVVLTSAFCLITLFIWIYVLNSLGLFY